MNLLEYCEHNAGRRLNVPRESDVVEFELVALPDESIEEEFSKETPCAPSRLIP